jgi:UTP--glucose-1-phosphate uridylyltransferase
MNKTKPVRKAVIAAAGFGTRFLPQTKAMPKEMLPLVDKPIIQHIVEELTEAGIEDIVIVTGYHKRSIEDHFDNISAELINNLKKSGKLEILEQTKKISGLANFIYIRQKGLLGNATPLLNAEHIIGDEPFIYTFADDFIEASPPRFKQMVDKYTETGSSVVCCMKVQTDEDYDRYGIVEGDEIADGVIEMKSIVEKPGKEKAPSDLASVSAYLFNPEYFQYLRSSLDRVPEGTEFMIQPAMCDMMDDGVEMLALMIKNGRYYDTGDKLEYLKTVVDFGLKDPLIKDGLLEHLRRVV